MKQIDNQYICSHRYCNHCKHFNQDEFDYYWGNTPVGRCEIIHLKHSSINDILTNLFNPNNKPVRCYTEACEHFEFSVHAFYGDDDNQTMADLENNDKVTSQQRVIKSIKNLKEQLDLSPYKYIYGNQNKPH